MPNTSAVLRRITPIAIGLIGASAFLTSPAAAESPATAAAQSTAGCYQVTVGDWINPPGPDVDYFAIPSEIRLEAAPAQRSGRTLDDAWALHPLQGKRPGEWALWQLNAAGDSVRLVWSTGYTGADVNAAIQPDRLEGLLRGFTDVLSAGQPPRIRPFSAIRISCGDDPDAPRVRALTTEDIWGATPPLPSCYVPLAVEGEEVPEGGRSWADALLALDTIVLGAPQPGDSRRGPVRPMLEGMEGSWGHGLSEDPRIRVGWGTADSGLRLMLGLKGDTLVGEARPRTPGGPQARRSGRIPPFVLGYLEFRALRVACGTG